MSDAGGPFLFLGGSLDGQRWSVAKPGEPYRVRHVEDPDEIYRASKIAGSTRTFTVYAADGWTGDDIIRRLVGDDTPSP